jgi:hypothetical protein
MNRELLIGALRQGKTGNEILQILEVLVPKQEELQEVSAE